MKKTIGKKLPPLKALYGLNMKAEAPLFLQSDDCVSVSSGWFHLHFGHEEKCGESLMVFTQSDSFLLSAGAQPEPSVRKRRKRTVWVFEVDGLPDEFVRFATRRTVLSSRGLSITYGLDQGNRDFLSVAIPARNLHLLFRDPGSHTTQPWHPRRATAVTDCAVIRSVPAQKAMTVESTGDAELDALLNSLG